MRYSIKLAAKSVGILLSIGCFASDLVQAKELEKTNLYGWTISAHANAKTGAFSHCAAGVPYKSGIFLVFSIGRNFDWAMGFGNPAWRLKPGSRYPISYQIDNSAAFKAEAVAVTSELVSVSLADSSALFELSRRGWILKVSAAGDEFSFSLDNSSKALLAALNCAHRYTVAARQPENSNPFAKRDVATYAEQPKSSARLQAEAATVTANVLAASGMNNFRLEDSVKPELDAFHAVWWVDELLGGTVISENENLDSAVNTLIASASQDCKGSFASMKLPSTDANAARMKAVCEQDGRTTIIQFANVVKRKKGGVYVFMLFQAPERNGDGKAVEDAGARLFDASLRLTDR